MCDVRKAHLPRIDIACFVFLLGELACFQLPKATEFAFLGMEREIDFGCLTEKKNIHYRSGMCHEHPHCAQAGSPKLKMIKNCFET
jgi:hypothetical protein